MSKTTVSWIMLTLLLIGMFTLVFNIQLAKADETIYIRADGTIDPSTANITTSDFVTYNFTNDNYGSIVVQRSNIVVDGNGYKLQGPGNGSGLDITSVNNVTVRNMNIHGFQTGINVKWSNYDAVYRNNITENSQIGIDLFWAVLYISISGNNITGNNQIGIEIGENCRGNITDNNIANGIHCDTSNMNVHRNNIVGGIQLFCSTTSMLRNNITGSISIANILGEAHPRTTDIFQNNITGTISVSHIGALAYITGNNIKSGVVLNNMAWASISVNNIQGGITFAGAFYASISVNNITSNYSGTGIYVNGGPSYYQGSITVFENNICENLLGISLIKDLSPNFGCSIYHNNFINNTHQVGNVTVSEVAWDDGYPSGGNYWSDYAGVDANNDGIGDTPYIIDANNTDHYPLMIPWAFEGPTIYIRADGSVNPTDAPLQRIGDQYTLTANITSVADGIVIQRDNITLSGAGYTIQGAGNGTGIDLSHRNKVTINNTTIIRFEYGLLLNSSTSNTLSNNNVTANSEGGIFVLLSSGNMLSYNNATANGAGIALIRSSDNMLSCNRITANQEGVLILDSSDNVLSANNITANPYVGIEILTDSHNNTLLGNNIKANGQYGIYFDSSPNNLLSGNNVVDNQYGLYLYHSSGNTFYHNEFIDNSQQVIEYNSTNALDDGYPSGGNYWSDYNGTDLYSGPYQNETESDEIGDTPYTIDENNTDNYPLMSPYKGHDIAVEYIEINKTIVAQGTIQKIDVKVINRGPFPQTFNLTVYANDTIIQTLLVYLAARARATIRFYWETSAQPYGNYTITAYAWPVSDETDTTDNTCIGSTVTVTIPGDVDGDFDVDLYDAVKLLTHYGAKAGQPAYDPVCDIDGNGNIDLYDATELLTNYGQKYP